MAQRPGLIALYAAGAAALAAVAGGVLAIVLRSPPPLPMIPHEAAPAPAPPLPAKAAEPPLTTTSPAAASNGRLTIRLIGGQPEK